MTSPTDPAPSDPHLVRVPLQLSELAPPSRARIKALRRHLICSLRDLREMRRPSQTSRPAAVEPAEFAATVAHAGCATCGGHCCKGGGEHAYIDERTMARVRSEQPQFDAGAVIRRYVEAIAPLSYRDSCLFHGEHGCTLPRTLRSDLCNDYWCNGLRDFLRRADLPDRVVIVAARDGNERRSAELHAGAARSG